MKLHLLLVLALTPGLVAPQELDQQELETLTDEIRRDIEKLRGTEFPRPVAVSVATKEEFLKYAHARLEKTSSPEEIQAEEMLAKLMGLIPVEMDLLETYLALVEEQVGGFYDPQTESFFLMDSFTGGLAKVILSHELTHALDDQLFDIDGTLEGLEGNDDRQLAYHGVVEGSGTTVMNVWTLRNIEELRGADLSQIDSIAGAGSENAPPFLWRPLMAAYLKGAAFFGHAASGVPAPEHFRRAFTTPPLSSEQLLHPEKYWDEETRDDPLPVEIDASGLPEGWEVIQEGTLGEVHAACWIEPLEDRKGLPTSQLGILGVKYTFPSSEGWGGDRYVLLGRGAERVLAVETRWDTEWDAGEFHAALSALEDHLKENVRALAKAQGLRRSGVEILPDPARRAVGYRAWIGERTRDIKRVLEAIEAGP